MTSESITSKVVRVMCMETVNILSSIHFPVPDRISVPSDYQAKFRVPFWIWGTRPPRASRAAPRVPHLPRAIVAIPWRLVDSWLVADREKIQFEFFKLANGGRLLRLTESQSGLSLEKKLAPADAVARQKEKLLCAFEAALAKMGLASP